MNYNFKLSEKKLLRGSATAIFVSTVWNYPCQIYNSCYWTKHPGYFILL